MINKLATCFNIDYRGVEGELIEDNNLERE